jgi:hypothetical protein
MLEVILEIYGQHWEKYLILGEHNIIVLFFWGGGGIEPSILVYMLIENQ